MSEPYIGDGGVPCPECGKPMTLAPGIDWFCNATQGCEYKKFRREFEKRQAPSDPARQWDSFDIIGRRTADNFLDRQNRDEIYPSELGSAIAEAIRTEFAVLQDPSTVHLNMLTGKIAKISMAQCAHTHGAEAVVRLQKMEAALAEKEPE